MAYNSQTKTIAIDQPVSVTDVQAALNTTVNNLAGLCTHASINKWSRFKPIPDSRPEIKLNQDDNYRVSQEGTQGDLVSSDGQSFHIELRGSSGIFVHVHANVNDCINPARCEFDWAYFKPIGKYQRKEQGLVLTTDRSKWSAFRLGDFRGYKHNAVSPFPSYTIPSVINKDTGIVDIRKQIGLTQITPGIGVGGAVDTSTPGSLTLNELLMPGSVSLSNAYLCLILQAKSTGALMYCTGTEITAGYRFNFGSIPTAFRTNGATAYLAYVNQQIAWNGTAVPGNLQWVRHPDMDAVSVTFGDATEAVGLHITIKQNEKMLPIGWEITLSVEDGMPAVRCTNNYIWLGNSNGELYQYPDKIDQNFLVTSGAPQTFSGQVIIANMNPKPNRLGISLQNGKYTKSIFIRSSNLGNLDTGLIEPILP